MHLITAVFLVVEGYNMAIQLSDTKLGKTFHKIEGRYNFLMDTDEQKEVLWRS